MATFLATASPALAHGELGGRGDLPLPLWLSVFGAAAALIVSFVALSALWTEQRFENRALPRAEPSRLQSLLTSRPLEWVIRIATLVVFLVVAMASARRAGSTETIGPIVVYAWFWVGLAFAHALLGNLWATLSPFDTIGRLVGFDDDLGSTGRPYPSSWGRWPAAILLFGFVWVELANPFGSFPGHLGILIMVYTLIQIAGMQRYGRRTWLENGEAFGVYFGLIAAMAPLTRDPDGRVVARPFLAGLAQIPPRPGLLPVIMVALGSTTFDGLSRSSLWTDATVGLTGPVRTAAFTAGLVAVIGVVTLAYVVAHYFSFLVIEGQLGLLHLSDPFGLGWDLFGTSDWTINLALLSSSAIWYVQVAAIVIGHVGGVVLAHDRAIALFERGEAVRTQYALLAVMVLFTASGLLILSG